MNVNNLFSNGNSFFHKLDGSVKLLFALLWSIIVFSFMDYRIFVALIIIGSLLLYYSKIKFKDIRYIIIFVFFFTVFNSLLLAIITPKHGSELVGVYTPFFTFGKYVLTKETLFFALTLSLKYFALLPISLIFVFTTNPSEFACSLNKIKVNYKISYSVSLALRYIPDVISEYNHIKNALKLKGIDFDGEKNKLKKLGKYKLILIPLIRSSIFKIDTISSGMDLRSFGLLPKRTWYVSRRYGKYEYISIFIMIIIFGIYLLVYNSIKTDLYYPFL